jgi:hypothetical protein
MRPLLIIGIILLAIAIIGGIYLNMFIYKNQSEETNTSEINDITEETENQSSLQVIEQSCISSSGNVTDQLCCQSSGNFPNTCLIGACGCSPTSSHMVRVCTCPEGECFDGNQCTQRQQMITVYCIDNDCSPQQIPEGAGTLAKGCYRNLNYCVLNSNSTCIDDSDCVGATCCHPTSCINKAYKGVCNLLCTQVCQGPLDCGAGHCGCVNNRCTVIPK